MGPLESELRALTYSALFKKATEAGVDLGDADDKLTIVSLLMIGLAGECFFFLRVKAPNFIKNAHCSVSWVYLALPQTVFAGHPPGLTWWV